MTRYADHATLTPARFAVLARIARGERFEIQRLQANWFVREGWLERVSPRTARPRYALTAKAIARLDAEPVVDARVTSSTTAYRSDSVKRARTVRP
jgi:hypothetical protein